MLSKVTGARLVVLAFASTSALAIACSNSPASCPSPGGPVAGNADSHCVGDGGTAIVQTTSTASCHPGVVDASASDAGASGDYGPPLDNASGDDDDCKYHVSWTSTPVCTGGDGVAFTVIATHKADNSPLTGANMEAEVFLSLVHPSPTPFVTAVEGPPGTYVTKPAKLDASGDWTIRYHFFEDCEDTLPDSPHGHAAFFVHAP